MITYFTIVAFAALGTFIAIYSWRVSRRGDPVDFFIASHGLGGFTSALTYAATTYSAFMMIGLVGFSYATGVGAFGFEAAYFVATLLLLATVGVKLWRISKAEQYISPSEFLASRYQNSITAALASLFMAIALIPYAAIQIIGPAILLELSSGGTLPYSTAVLITTALVLMWGFIGGFRGVAWTDALQGLLMLGSAVLVVVWVFSWGVNPIAYLASMEHISLKFPNWFWTPGIFLAYTLPWVFFAVTNPQVVQRLFAPKDFKSYRMMVIGFASFGLLYTLLTTILGLALRGYSELGMFPSIDINRRANWNLVTPTLLSLAIIPQWLSALVALSVLAAAVTTIDSIALTVSSMVTRDLLGRTLSTRCQVAAGRAILVGLTIFIVSFAYLKPAFIVDLAVKSSTLLLPFAPLFIGGLLHKKTAKYTSLLVVAVGFLFTLSVILLGASSIHGIPLCVWTLAASTIIYSVGVLVESRIGKHPTHAAVNNPTGELGLKHP